MAKPLPEALKTLKPLRGVAASRVSRSETTSDSEVRKRLGAVVKVRSNGQFDRSLPAGNRIERTHAERQREQTEDSRRLGVVLISVSDLVDSQVDSSFEKFVRLPRKKSAYNIRILADTCCQLRRKNGKLSLPPLPAGLKWPVGRYDTERQKGVTLVKFLDREWKGLIERGYGELRWLRLIDPEAATAVSNYERLRKGVRRRLPAHIRFLVEREITDLKLSLGLKALQIGAGLARNVSSTRKPKKTQFSIS